MKSKHFIFEKYHKQTEFFKENSYYLMKRLKKKYLLMLSNKLTENIPDPSNSNITVNQLQEIIP